MSSKTRILFISCFIIVTLSPYFIVGDDLASEIAEQNAAKAAFAIDSADFLRNSENPIELEKEILDTNAYCLHYKWGCYFIRYALGKRESGDNLVSSYNDQLFYGLRHKMTLLHGVLSDEIRVTYVETNVTQSFSSGRVAVLSGGIGKRYIKLEISTPYTNTFNYVTSVYGIPEK